MEHPSANVAAAGVTDQATHGGSSLALYLPSSDQQYQPLQIELQLSMLDVL